MNKNFSTLMALALLAGSLPVAAQNAHPNGLMGANGEIPYRSQFVKSASLDEGFYKVNNIESDKWYQLVVNMPNSDDTRCKAKAGEITYVLTQERDYSTGKLYLAVKPIQDAVLTHSLWKIERIAQDVNVSYYTFTNKETGYTLTFDHTDALKLDADGVASLDADALGDTNAPMHGRVYTPGDLIKYLDPSNFEKDRTDYYPSILRGCATNWSWYSYSEQTNQELESKLLYTSFHSANAQDSIMALAMVKVNPTNMGTTIAQNYDNNQYYVRTIKASAKDFLDAHLYDDLRSKALVHVRPVVAGAKVLNAEEVNSMIDADGSFLNFTNNSSVNPGYKRDRSDATVNEKVKFTVYQPGTDKAISLYENPFDSAWVAVESPFEVLDRRNFRVDKSDIADAGVTPNWNGNANIYAGYNILFRNVDAADKNTYLKVWDKTYETPQGGGYNALKVAGLPNAELSALISGEVTNKAMTADRARYHWKVTYYATNDSVVLEPLNASRNTYEDKNLVVDETEFFNTVNKGVAFSNSTSTGEAQAYKKAAGVPVALYAQNIGAAAADVQAYLTVGSPNGYDYFNDYVYSAFPKYDMSVLNYAADYDGENDALYYKGKVLTSEKWRVAGDNPAWVTNGASALKEIVAHAKRYDVVGEYTDMKLEAVNSSTSYIDGSLTKDYNGLYFGKVDIANVTNDGTQWLRLQFNHKYTPLVRTTVADGLYFINLKTSKDYIGNAARRNGSYLAYNHVGRMIYAMPNENQDFNNMPATQWVVKQIRCQVTDGEVNINKTPEVAIYNREYGVEGAPVFQGQLYTTEDGAVYLINHRDYYNVAKTDGKFIKNAFSCGDTLVIKAVENEAALTDQFHGYAELGMYEMEDTTEFLSYSAEHPYYLRYNDKTSDEEQTNTFKYLFENPEGYLAVTNPDNISADVQQSLFEIEKIATDEYGYGKDVTYADGKKLPQLKRTVYALKVRDNNTVDNNRKYVCVMTNDADNQRYVVRTLDQVDGQKVKIAEFYLKSNEVNVDRTKEAYILVDARGLDNVKGDKAANAVNLNNDIFYQPNILDTEISDLVDVKGTKLWDGRKFIENGWQILEMVNDPDKLYAYDMDNQWNKDFTAFTIDSIIRPLYKPVEEVRDVNGNIDIYKRDGMGDVKQKLFEMSKNQYTTATSLTWRKDVNYLGMTSEGIKPAAGKTTAMYVDGVVTSPVSPIPMPQYMLWVANDSVADGFYCEDYLEAPGHGYFADIDAANKDDMKHFVYYNGYVSGRMLVNFNDSVATYKQLNKLDEASKFKYNNRVRLGFVEGVHMFFTKEELAQDGADKYFAGAVPTEDTEVVYVLHSITLDDIRDISTNVKGQGDEGHGYINPKKLKEAIDKNLIDVKTLDGTHRNYVWSFRYTEDDITGPNEGTEFGHEDFLMESFDNEDGKAGKAKIGGYEGAWVGLDGNIPVLRKNYTNNGDHNNLEGEPIHEGLNQATIFGMLSETEDKATANEEIATSSVIVAGVDGAVVVKGAEGKNVIVSTILGKVVANEVLNSDNAQISAPAGIVVVSVDGESFKVAVK